RPRASASARPPAWSGRASASRRLGSRRDPARPPPSGREWLNQTFLRLPDQDHDPVHAEQLLWIRGHAILLPATPGAPDGRSYPPSAHPCPRPPLTLRVAGANLAR